MLFLADHGKWQREPFSGDGGIKWGSVEEWLVLFLIKMLVHVFVF